MDRICICGGGSLGHVIAGFLSGKKGLSVSILTNRPNLWEKEISVHTPSGENLYGHLNTISANPALVIPQADVILFCLPGFLIEKELESIKEYINPNTFVGTVFSSTGFFFEAQKILKPHTILWGFQRVPFIARVENYGHSAKLLGYKQELKIAVENTNDAQKEKLRQFIEDSFECPTYLLRNYLEASLTNSNPILHTSRLYTLFHSWEPGKYFSHNTMFYEEWDDLSSETLIKMDEEFFQLLEVLPVTPNFLPRILDYYESNDAHSLTQKLRSIESFKGICSPMKKGSKGWTPDFNSRYFTEDFLYGLKIIHNLALEKKIFVSTIDKVYRWGCNMLEENAIISSK